MDRDERLMAVLGSRLLESNKKVGETADAIELRASGEHSILSNIATSVSESLSQVLRWAYWWNSTEASPEDVTSEQVTFELNTDFSTKGLSAQEIQSIVAAWQAGAISRDTMSDLFRRGEVLPEGRTNEEEAKMVGAQHSPALAASALKLHFEAGGLGEFGLARVKAQELFQAERLRDADMEQVHAAHAHHFRVVFAQLLGFAEGVGPRDGDVREDAILQVGLDVLKRGLAALRVDLLAEDSEPKGVAQFVPVQRREGQRVAKVAHEGEGLLRVGLREVKANQKAGVSVGFQCTPLLYSRMSFMARAAMTWPPSRNFKRAARLGRFLARGGLTASGGESNATIFPRLLISTCSPSLTQSRTVLKSCRTCRMVAVFMCHNHVTQWAGCQLSPRTAIQSIVAAGQAGAISRDTMSDLFRRGEVLPEGRTNEEEKRLIPSMQKADAGQ